MRSDASASASTPSPTAAPLPSSLSADTAVDVNAIKIEGTRYTHEEQIKARIEFLNFVLFNSAVEMLAAERDHLVVLWTSLVEGALTKVPS